MILRQNVELTLSDFTAHPFWHWCEADRDFTSYPDDIETETLFRAHEAAYPVPKTASGYAKAVAFTADERQLQCCVFQCSERSEIEFGFFLHSDGQIRLRHRIEGESSSKLVEQINWLTEGAPDNLAKCFPATCYVENGVLAQGVSSIVINGFDCIHIVDGQLIRRNLP